MNFALSDEALEFKTRCRRFAREVIRPVAARHDAEESTPWDVIFASYDWGLNGIEFVQLTGSDPTGQFNVICAEELAWGCAGITIAIAGSMLGAMGIIASGSPDQIAEWVPQCLGDARDPKLGAYAVTEPQAGSDVRSLRTTAKRDGDEWVLNGTKVFITNGGIADVHVVVATVDPELGHRGQASFVLPKGTPGLRQGKKESKLGIRASHTAEVILEDCRVPLEYLLGGLDKLERKLERARAGESTGRSSNALATFELTRPVVGAWAVGIAQAAYEWTLAHLAERAAGDPIWDMLDESSTANAPPLQRQGVQHVLADVATEIEAARLLVQRASWMARNGRPMTGGQGSMSKLKGGDVAVWTTRTLMDLVGPFAQTRECPLEKWFRDAKIHQVFEGTAEIQRLVIARMQAAEYAQARGTGDRASKPATAEVAA